LTLELPWKNNQPKFSCIPEGEYEYRIAKSPRLGTDVIWIDDVQGRTSIQIHTGNFTSQILGCILVGNAISDINNDGILDVSQSKLTFDKLLSNISREGIIRIQSAEILGKGVFI
jgi:hypothetical protein